MKPTVGRMRFDNIPGTDMDIAFYVVSRQGQEDTAPKPAICVLREPAEDGTFTYSFSFTNNYTGDDIPPSDMNALMLLTTEKVSGTFAGLNMPMPALTDVRFGPFDDAEADSFLFAMCHMVMARDEMLCATPATQSFDALTVPASPRPYNAGPPPIGPFPGP